ncbi:hypothetical protein SO802_003543 [Lithocarpus litseifolius]|uniref:Uncharacterized protein n=1 Tax=Lithocarpus litseifolius TaxID=425828 RepID=A0AAW2E254_9ROSI
MEPPNTGFEPGLKGFLGDFNASLSAPNDSELLALLPLPCGPNMDHEVSNTVNDLRLLEGIHDGCNLSSSLNDSDERESEPHLFPDTTNEFDFSFAQPNLDLGSSVSDGFHLDNFFAGWPLFNNSFDQRVNISKLILISE